MKEIFFLITIIIITNFLFNKFNLLLNYNGQKHQIFNQISNVPLTGGIFILLGIYGNYNFLDHNLVKFLTAFFILGLLADINVLQSALYRFLLQVLLVFFFVLILDLSIFDIRIDYINILLEFSLFNIFFVSFCFLVLINGTNFIDGNNGNSLGYYIIVLSSLLLIEKNNNINYESEIILKFLTVFLILYFFNILNFLYLGDNGVYLVSILVGYFVIDFIEKNPTISPYYIATLLWYPSFEILFSLLRKIKKKYSPFKPDVFHLHQLLFIFLLKKTSKNKVFINSLTGFMLNFFNFLILYFSSFFIFSTKTQVMIIILAIMLYIMIYKFLVKIKYN